MNYLLLIGLFSAVFCRNRDNLPEWNHLIYGYSSHSCYNIPTNFTLCKNIGYQKMILPNFLQHETLNEAIKSSNDWLILTDFNCHNDTRRFLCSLYAPVCVPNETVRKIQPCRELCQSVKEACSASMLTFGYKWPDILHCDKFPQKYAGLCIRGTEGKVPQAYSMGQRAVISTNNDASSTCNCQSIFSQRDIDTKFCQATTVLKAKITKIMNLKNAKYTLKLHKKSKIIKSRFTDLPLLRVIGLPCYCNELKSELPDIIKKGRWLLMGEVRDRVFYLTSLMRWRRNDRTLKRTIKRMRRQEKRICGASFKSSDDQIKGLNILGQKTKRRRKRRNRKNRGKSTIGP